MAEQRITVTCFAGEPLERMAIAFKTLDGTVYQLTHYETIDGQTVWIHGYREDDGVRFYTQRTPDELDGWKPIASRLDIVESQFLANRAKGGR